MRFLNGLRLIGREQGEDLVELALVLPMLLVVMMIVLDVGRAFNTYMVLLNAAREGAHQATSNPYDTAAITGAALYETRNAGLADGDVVISIVPASSGNPVRVSIQYGFALLSGLLPMSSIPLSATVDMVAF
jgi:Flp pilus assembly protein TadG